jgi:hypothetical protein
MSEPTRHAQSLAASDATAQPNRRKRTQKLLGCGLLATVLLLAYPLGWGPWIYMHDELPTSVQRAGNWYYTPMKSVLQSSSFRRSVIGGLYVSYLRRWFDSKYGKGEWDSRVWFRDERFKTFSGGELVEIHYWDEYSESLAEQQERPHASNPTSP